MTDRKLLLIEEQATEILRLSKENYRLRKAFAEVKEIAESNDVMLLKRKALRRHLLEAVDAAAALKETGDE